MFPQVLIDDSCQNNSRTGPEKIRFPILGQATKRWEMLLFYKRIFIYAKLRKSYVTNINLYISYIYRFIPKQN